MKDAARTRPLVPVEKELWSEKSKAGLDYDFAPEFYSDKPFVCRACSQPGVFTAEQQKYTYEVKKAYTWEQHVLCTPCFERRLELMSENSSLSAAWSHDKAAMARNLEVLERWKTVLEELPKYGVRKDSARIRMLARLVMNAT